MKRKYFIKDLYRPTQVLLPFTEVEFESLQCFADFTTKGLYQPKQDQRLILPVAKKEILHVNKLLAKSYLCDKTNVILRMSEETFLEFLQVMTEDVSKKHFSVLLGNISFTLHELFKKGDYGRFWIQKNPIWIEKTISYENYKRILNEIISIYNQTRMRFFRLRFDYQSFDAMTLRETRELQFRCNQFVQWFRGTREEKYKVEKLEVDKFPKKSVFVDNDYNLYVHRRAFEANDPFFHLGEHMNQNGEEIDFHDLADLRAYSDIKVEYHIPQIRQFWLIDYWQNKKILGEYVEIPMITQLFERWLYV